MIGYHHVLMIIIAVAIILLCKFLRAVMNADLHVCHWNATNDNKHSCWLDVPRHLRKSQISF